MYEKNLVEEGEGNISAIIPEKNEILITPNFNKYYNLITSDVVHIKIDGILHDKGKSSMEYRLHVALYNSRPRTNFVFYTDSPYTTILSVSREGIHVLLEE